MELSHKQYLISNRRQCLRGMDESPLDGGLWLYAGAGLQVKKGKTAAGLPYVLIGEAYCTDVFPKRAWDDLDTAQDGDIFEISKYWTGRWVLMLGGEMITDACGLMSAFFHSDGRTGQWLVSSSLALASVLAGSSASSSGCKVASSGLNWQLLPLTLSDKVRLMFCTEKLVLGEEPSFSFHNRFGEWKDKDFDSRVRTVTCSLVTALKNISRFSGRRIWLALTAGKDSRLRLPPHFRREWNSRLLLPSIRQ